MIRFILGMVIMIGSLIFLGCPLRMVIRMSAGDLNAWVALIGFVLGVGTGAFALKKGFSLGRAHETNKESGAVLPVLMLGILAQHFSKQVKQVLEVFMHQLSCH